MSFLSFPRQESRVAKIYYGATRLAMIEYFGTAGVFARNDASAVKELYR